MRHQTLELIEAQDPLAKLFNQYMNKLSTMDMTSYPMDSMRELFNEKPEDKYYQYRRETLYEITCMGNALHAIHRLVNIGLKDLSEYETDFNFDWKHYATVKRSECIQEYGGDDCDYNEDGSIKFKEDNKSLKGHTMKSSLNGLFQTKNNDMRGERIGSSHPFDFMRFTTVVRTNTQYSLFKAFQAVNGKELNVFREGPDGEMRVLNMAERVESEMNEDIKNGLIADTFEAVLLDGEKAAKVFNSIKQFQNEEVKYRQLQFLLKRMLNLTYELTE
jgi:hypothetical protein